MQVSGEVCEYTRPALHHSFTRADPSHCLLCVLLPCLVVFRIPDTHINLSGNYQQGRTNVQMSCVPDEYAPLLGANGFTHGVGPGNLGLSVNLNI
jgi:hypothetical protein